MKKLLASAAAVAVAVSAGAFAVGQANAQDKLVIAVVPSIVESLSVPVTDITRYLTTQVALPAE